MLDDSLVTISEEPFTLGPGETKTITYKYTATQDDVNAGEIKNTATATGKDPGNNNVTASDDAVVTTVPAAPELTVTKAANKVRDLVAGDIVEYTITVRNSGNVTISEIEVKDILVSFTGDGGFIDSLAPGESKKIIYNYTVTQADQNAGKIVNTATATGTAADGTQVTGRDTITVETRTTPTPPPGGGGNPPGGGGGNPPGGGGGNPAVAPAAPAPTTTIANPPTPTTIIDEPAPKAITAYWALINLICAILTALLSIIMLIRFFTRRKEEDEETGEEEKVQRKGALRIASIIPAIGAIIAFILTEDMSLPMQMVDKWTVLMIIILAIQVLVAIFANFRREDDDDEEEADATA